MNKLNNDFIRKLFYFMNEIQKELTRRIKTKCLFYILPSHNLTSEGISFVSCISFHGNSYTFTHTINEIEILQNYNSEHFLNDIIEIFIDESVNKLSNILRKEHLNFKNKKENNKNDKKK